MKTQDLEQNTDENTNSTSIELSLGKIKTLQRDLAEKTRENQVLSLNIQKLQKELFSVEFQLFLLTFLLTDEKGQRSALKDEE